MRDILQLGDAVRGDVEDPELEVLLEPLDPLDAIVADVELLQTLQVLEPFDLDQTVALLVGVVRACRYDQVRREVYLPGC
jgi:hypothetical protein